MPIILAGSERRRVVDRDTGAGGVAGSAHGSTERWRAVGAGGLGALGCAASVAVAGAAGGVAFTRAARAAGLLGSKGGGSVGFLTWSGDGVESAAPTVFAGGEIGSPLCA
jgi:hypothetical protein